MPYFRVRASDGTTETVFEERFSSEQKLREVLPKRGWTQVHSIEEIPDPAATAIAGADVAATAPIPVRPGEVRDDGEWKVLDPAIAARHPLHGVAGWAMLLAVLTVLGVIGNAIGLVYLVILAIGTPLTLLWVMAAVAAIALAWTTFVAAQLTKLSPSFPLNFTLLMAASIVLSLVSIALGPDASDFITIAVSAAWTAYVHMSRRIQVTYRHRVRNDDPFLKQLQPAPA